MLLDFGKRKLKTRVFIAICVGAIGMAFMSGCDHASETPPNITVDNARVRAPLPGHNVAAAWFDIANAGGSDVLVSATSPISDTIEIHTHEMTGGVMKMRKLDNVKIEACVTTQFKPGGFHLMIFNAETPGGAMSVPLTLKFARSGERRIEAKLVTFATDMGTLDHSGH